MLLPVVILCHDLLSNLGILDKSNALVRSIRTLWHIPRKDDGQVGLLVAAHELRDERRSVRGDPLHIPNIAGLQLLRVVAFKE